MHQDEKHAYIHAETGERCMSRSHLQCYVVPEHNGKLNGKWFSSRANMIKLNNSIHPGFSDLRDEVPINA